MEQIIQVSITSKVPICHSDNKISAVRKYLQENIGEFDTVNYIYVLSKSSKLKGIISIRELFANPSDSYVRNHMASKLIKAHADTDQEIIAHLAIKNNIKSIPIVEKDNTFLGVISSDDILHILHSEASEDFMLMTGIIPTKGISQDKLPILRSFISRVPWIIIGLFGGIFAASIISSFESTLEKEVMIAAFIPLVVYVANAVGIQSQTLYIRDLAVSQNVPVIRYALRQVSISALIGAVCWLTIVGVSLIFWHYQMLGMIVGFAVFCAVIVAVIFAIGIPYLLLKLNKDPAIGSGPFTTIIQDILSVIIYFLIVSMFI